MLGTRMAHRTQLKQRLSLFLFLFFFANVGKRAGNLLGKRVPNGAVTFLRLRLYFISIERGAHRKKAFDIPVPNRVVTYQTLSRREKFIYDVIIPAQGEFGK
jgi:hypothetical protein